MVEFYKQVPKDFAGNLAYRIDLRRRAEGNRDFQRAVIHACREDVLYFFNALCFLYEPRPKIVDGLKLPHMVPFITWPHQDPAILTIRENLGFEDIGVEKSRGEGASWILVLMALHDWLFKPMTAIGMVSRNENAVDNPEDPDSLFWKLDWELTKLPRWMVPSEFKRSLQEHTLRNLDNKSTIAGYPATADVGTGGRKAWFGMDELSKFPRGPDREAMASTQYVTNSRFVVSTPKGSEGAYYELMHEPSSMVKVTISWIDNPTRNRGMYRFEGEHCVAVDPANNPLPADYEIQSRTLFSRLRAKGFKLEGRLRSPWYDHECDRPGATPQNIAQELDRDYGGSMYRIFGADFFEKAEADVRPAFARGLLHFHKESLSAPEFDRSDDGPLLLWTSLDHQLMPPNHQYVVGVDCGTGLGGSYTSNSTIEVVDLVTMEQVLEFASNSMAVPDFADLTVALCKWLYDAYLIWEINGPGAGFTHRIKASGYNNVYLRTLEKRKGRKKSKELGWWTSADTKEKMFSELLRSVKGGELKLHSDTLVKECGQYVRINGKIEHILATTTKDDSSRGQAHGDRAIAMAVCLQGVRDRPLMVRSEEKSDTMSDYYGEPPANTLAARQRVYEQSQETDRDGWSEWDEPVPGREAALAW